MSKKVEGETIVLDGRILRDTEFVGCLLIYKGGSVPILRNNVFSGCTFNFENGARNTIDFLRSMIHGAGNDSGKEFVVQGLLGVTLDEPEKG